MPAPEHSDLPLPDYDHLLLPALGHRIRSLTETDVKFVLDYERSHADRPAAVQLLETRIAEMAAGAAPAPGRPADGPEWPPPPITSSSVGPQTAAPSVNPPPHGTPDQPAKPKGNRQSP